MQPKLVIRLQRVQDLHKYVLRRGYSSRPWPNNTEELSQLILHLHCLFKDFIQMAIGPAPHRTWPYPDPIWWIFIKFSGIGEGMNHTASVKQKLVVVGEVDFWKSSYLQNLWY